jgi:uroporphyrinogen-III synthase
MKKAKLKILSTKSLRQETLDTASLHDIEIDELPFIITEPIKDEDLKNKLRGFLQQNITAVFTSKNAMLAFTQIVNGEVPWKIFCIGQATKKSVAKVFGEEKISGTADNASELAGIILQDAEIKKLVFFCGKQRREELPAKLSAAEIELEEIVVYETFETPKKISRKNYDGILFFSPSAVRSFFSLNKINKVIQIFAIGKTTSDAIQQHTSKKVIAAEISGEQNVIDTVISHFSTTTKIA